MTVFRTRANDAIHKSFMADAIPRKLMASAILFGVVISTIAPGTGAGAETRKAPQKFPKKRNHPARSKASKKEPPLFPVR